jgi:hypothetical protein
MKKNKGILNGVTVTGSEVYRKATVNIGNTLS